MRTPKHPAVAINEVHTLEDGQQRKHLDVRFSNIDDRHIAGLKELVPNLIDLIESVRAEDLAQRARHLARAYRPYDWIRPHVQTRADTSYLRSAFLREVPTGRAIEVARRVCADADDPAGVLRKWRDDGVVLGVDIEGRDLYPLFQFDAGGSPYPIVRELMGLFRTKNYSDWDIAMWFFCATGWLDGDSPMSLVSQQTVEIVGLLREAAAQTLQTMP